MKRLLSLGWLAAMAALRFRKSHGPSTPNMMDWSPPRQGQWRAGSLVHRVIVRESRYQPGLVGRGGTIGLMQIKLATRAPRLHRRRGRAARSNTNLPMP